MNKICLSKKEIILVLILIGTYLVSRLINLTSLPIFTDEAIYLRWAQIAKNDAAWRFISLTDGKQPLFVWATIVTMRIISDPLMAGRFVSVLTGLFGLIGMWFLGYEIGKRKEVGFLSALLYIILPFSLMYDRMALMDTTLAAFTVWSLYLEILLIKTLRLDVAMILGMVLGGGILTKTSGFFGIYLLPFSLIIYSWEEIKKRLKLFKWLGLAFIAVIISQLIYAVLRLSPFFYLIAQKDTTFIWTVKEFLSQPFASFVGNFLGLWHWFTSYMTFPLVVMIMISFFVGIYKKEKEKVLVFLWFIIPFLSLASFGKVIYPRFILFMSIPLLVLIADLWYKIFLFRNKLFIILTAGFILIYPLFFDHQILFNIIGAPIVDTDRGQYIFGIPAGGGVPEALLFFKEQAKTEKIFIATEGTFGLMPYALELYLGQNPNVEIKGYWPVDKIPEEVIKKSKDELTFFLFYQRQDISNQWPLKKVLEYRKGTKEDRDFFLRIFQVL